MEVVRVFCGYDEREKAGYEAFIGSMLRRHEGPIQVTRLDQCGLGQVGSNAFTLSRFLVPKLCEYKGHAIFCDASDQILLAGISELDALFDPRFAVQVVQHLPYKTKHPIKYIGTEMECPNVDYVRKNWASVMLINCEHPAWQFDIESKSIRDLLQFRFLSPEFIGHLPAEWNRLVDEGQPTDGKLLHWTAGIPAFDHYKDSPGADIWFREAA